MNNIEMKFLANRVGTKEIRTKEGKVFKIPVLKLGDKEIRISLPKDHELPKDVIEGNLYPRKFTGKSGAEFYELAIFVTNALPIEEQVEEAPAEESAEHVESGEEGLPF